MALDLARISEATDIRALVQSAGVKLRIHQRVGIGCCPFHQERTPSFRVNLPGHRFAGKWRCHGACGIGGDCFDFVMRIDCVTMPEAIRRLASDAGIPLDRPETPQERRQRTADKEEREMCAWWFRQQWKEARSGLNRAMALGPEPMGDGWNLAGQLADFYGSRMRWIERERKTDAGMAQFRAAVVPTRSYREHLTRAARLKESQMDFVALVMGSLQSGDKRRRIERS